MEVVPIAQLHTVEIERLNKADQDEAAKLFQAAKEDGVFYLDLQDPSFAAIFDSLEDIFDLSKELFSLSEEDKMNYDVDEIGQLKLDG